jgi:hypothetical protein
VPFRAFGTQARELTAFGRVAKSCNFRRTWGATFTTHDGTLRSRHKAALFMCSFVGGSVRFVMPAGIGECNPPIPEGPFPLSRSSRAQGLQEVGQRPVQRTVKKKLGEAIVALVREEL